MTKSKSIGFENGLAGIGYVLKYLINNQYIDADFNDLFKDKDALISSSIEEIMHSNRRDLTLIRVLYYIDIVDRSSVLFNSILLYHYGVLNMLIQDYHDGKSEIIKRILNESLYQYLKVIYLLDILPNEQIINEIFDILHESKYNITQLSFLYLIVLNDKDLIPRFKYNEQLISLFKHSEKLDILRQNLEVSVLLSRTENLSDEFEIKIPADNIEAYINATVSSLFIKAGFGFGVSRLLMFELIPNDDFLLI